MTRDQEDPTPARLYQYFKDAGIGLREIAEHTGYSYQHVAELLNGTEHLSDAARFKFIAAYPATAGILMPRPNGNGDCH